MSRKGIGRIGIGGWILIAMIAGIAAGALLGDRAAALQPLGTLFIGLIKMLVIPLVALSIVTGAASIGNTGKAGKIGIGTFAYYLGTTAVAVSLGLAFGLFFEPGAGIGTESFRSFFSEEYAGRGAVPGFWETVYGFIPQNPFAALAGGNILQVLFFCLFFGFGLSALPAHKKEPLVALLSSGTDILLWMIMKVMLLAPVGVFGLMADAVGTFGWEILGRLALLFAIYVAALLIQTFGLYPLLIKLFSGFSPRRFIRTMTKVQIVAASTSSSMATLPVNMRVCEEELGLSPATTSFVLPLGATINMDGNAIYYALAAVFFAQLFGIDLGPAQIVAIMLTATLGSIGQAGVPGPSLLVVAVLLAADIPVTGLPLLFGVDRLFDMLRTAVNVTGDASCAVVMDRFSREK